MKRSKSDSAGMNYLRYILNKRTTNEKIKIDQFLNSGQKNRTLASLMQHLISYGDFGKARCELEKMKGLLGRNYKILRLSLEMESGAWSDLEDDLPSITHLIPWDSRIGFALRVAANDPKVAGRLRAAPHASAALRACAELADDHRYRYEEARSRAEGVRKQIAAARSDASVSLVCPVHRLDDIDRLAETLLAQQGAGKIEALVCFNNCDASAGTEKLRALTRDMSMPIAVMDCGEVPLGRVMNLGMERAEGEILCKIDADNIYFPGYVSNIRNIHSFHSAEFSGHSDAFILFEEGNIFAFCDCKIGEYGHSGSCRGGTISVKKSVWERTRWEDELWIGEDVSFFRRCRALGYKMIDRDAFDYITVRKRNESHSHKTSPLEILGETGYILGDRGCLNMASLDSPP